MESQIELTNEEIARVFAMGKDWQTKGGDIIQYCGHTPDFKNPVVFYPKQSTMLWCEWQQIEMLAIPLSKVSDEHAIEVANVYTGNVRGYVKAKNDELIRAGKETVTRIVDRYSNFVKTLDFVFAYQHLILKGYAVPLYFGINHPANGKTAIELNIAKEKTDK